MAKIKTEVVSLTASEVWELRRRWHKDCDDFNNTPEGKRHIAVCDALESWARELEPGERTADFTGRMFDFRKKRKH